MIARPALRALRSVDWDFAVSRAGYVPPPHWYPGTFIAAISDAMIEALSPPGGVVFDPYSGIGTAGWSAIRKGRSGILADANPVAALTSYYSMASLLLAANHPALIWSAGDSLTGLAGGADNLFSRIASTSPHSRGIDAAVAALVRPAPATILKKTVVGPPNWTALDPWFERRTLLSLKRLHVAIESLHSSFLRVMATCMTSNALRSLSSQNASWGHIADNVLPRERHEKDVLAACLRWISNSRKFWKQSEGLPRRFWPTPGAEVRIIDWARDKGTGTARADLLLTSPPYAGAIDYFLAQRLSLYFLGYDDKAIAGLVRGEIGARRKRSTGDSRSQWAEDLAVALHKQLSWLKARAAVCLVLPHKDSGRSNGEERLRSELVESGFEPIFQKDRSIHQSHTRQSWTSIKRETISVLVREA